MSRRILIGGLRRRRIRLTSAGLWVLLLASCQTQTIDHVQGYVEGEFVYVASPLAGQLLSLPVQRGAQVKSDQLLFALDRAAEQALRDTAERRVAQARDTLEDLQKGKRPSEIASIEAQLEQAKAAHKFSEAEYVRMANLLKSRATSVEEFEQSRTTRDQDRQRVAQLEAELSTAKLGARSDQIAAAQDEMHALESALTKAEWDLSQKHQKSTQAALVFDTFYREGEWVPAGRPVVALLPPTNIKVRAFVPQAVLGGLHHGDQILVTADGAAESFHGTISFISPRAEYTPPVIYSQESRDKLVYMVEIVFPPEAAAQLHPGQPVVVRWNSR